MTVVRSLFAPVILALTLGLGPPPTVQSGRGLMHGYVAFDDVSYNGDTVLVHGRFELELRRVPGAGWRIRSIATRPPG